MGIQYSTLTRRYLVSVIILAGILPGIFFVLTRLMPESSPVARGSEYAATHRCKDNLCRAELNGNLECPDKSSDTSCEDLSLYWQAMALRKNSEARLKQSPNNWLLQGEQLARERNCFRCHGELGQGGFTNSGALKGYIPGYYGKDFRALTGNGHPEYVREWIRTGSAKSVTDHPLTGLIARHFLDRQAVSMPIFASLSDPEINLLADYVIALNQLGPLDQRSLRCYTLATSLKDDEHIDDGCPGL